VSGVTTSLVTTIPERCRVCYTCVRECPAKAIRITGGQAQVIGERCIGCGNCVRVCSQQAKRVLNSIEDVDRLLRSGRPVAACVAPSFPAEFGDVDALRLVGALRALGFARVNEVAFGADLVARQYRRLLEANPKKRYISTPCPAVIGYVERYHTGLIPALAPIVSPMVAMARVLHQRHGGDLLVVFIGPCIAKKAEAVDEPVRGEVDAVLTFCELREMFDERGIEISACEPSDFDRPHAGMGGLFPISRGLLQAAQMDEDLLSGESVTAEGRTGFVEAIEEFKSGDLKAHLLDVLCCDGCIAGPGVTKGRPPYARRALVARYVRRRMDGFDRKRWQREIETFSGLDLSRTFSPKNQRIPDPSESEIRAILARMGKHSPQDELDCGACGYHTCREHAIAIYEGLAESEMCLPYTIDQLRRTVGELASTQEALMHSERLASMGQLAAGIAHEVNNPLGVVLMYAHLLMEQVERDSPLRKDLELIAEQSDRCKKIVAGLLNFARQQKVVRRLVDVRELVEHALHAVPAPDNVQIEIHHDLEDPQVEIDPDQFTQVLLNLIQNAYDAMPEGGTLEIRTGHGGDRICFAVRDTGVGIPQENLTKIFEPFFTTKPMGQGTGLGLAVTYGIVKMHCGDIRVKSDANTGAGSGGTTFMVSLPVRAKEDVDLAVG